MPQARTPAERQRRAAAPTSTMPTSIWRADDRARDDGHAERQHRQPRLRTRVETGVALQVERGEHAGAARRRRQQRSGGRPESHTVRSRMTSARSRRTKTASKGAAPASASGRPESAATSSASPPVAAAAASRSSSRGAGRGSRRTSHGVSASDDDADRDVDQEHPAPPERVCDQAAEHEPRGAPDGGDAGPRRRRAPAIPGERIDEQRECGGSGQARRPAPGRARAATRRSGAGREPARQRRPREDGRCPTQEDAPAAAARPRAARTTSRQPANASTYAVTTHCSSLVGQPEVPRDQPAARRPTRSRRARRRTAPCTGAPGLEIAHASL